MSRTKIRNYPSLEEQTKIFEDYLQEHKAEYQKHILLKMGYDDMESLLEAERKATWGFDCGWVQLYPKNKEMAKEWKLDNGDYGGYIFDIASNIMPVQSVTLKRPIIEKLLEDLNIENDWGIISRLD